MPEVKGAEWVYRILLDAYGPQAWWPAETAFEVAVGAVLTQDTAWHNVAIAIGNLRSAGLLNEDAIREASSETVKEAIRPSGFYNVKYRRLMNLLTFFAEQGGFERLAHAPNNGLRAALLAVDGIGPETADSILLYALGQPVFVIDNYTRRLFGRLGHTRAQDATYDALQAWFERNLPRTNAVYKEYHALIVQHCKTRCKKAPVCDACPLLSDCTWVRDTGALRQDERNKIS